MCKPKELGGLGFRHLETLHKVCGAKLFWRLSSGSKALWKDVLRNKYNSCEDDVNGWRVKQGDSSFWKFIYNQKQIVERGSKWFIRNGNNVSFLHDQWVKPRIRISEFVQDNNDAISEDSKVADWLNTEGLWKLDIMENIIPSETIECIKAIVPPNPRLGKDAHAWGYSNSGEFTVRSAYDLMSQEHMEEGNSRT